MNWNINDIPIFVAIIEQMGISAAAEQLNMPKSTISRSLSRLEEALGVRLLERNSRQLRITSEGEAFYRHSILIMEQVDEANAKMMGLTSVPSGKLVVTLPMAFSREIVAKHLHLFTRKYPQIELEIMITSHPVDIIREQIDVAVMIGPLSDSELIARKLLSSRLIWVTSPVYKASIDLGGMPEDLVQHVEVCEKRYAKAKITVKYQSNKRHINLTKVIRVNDPIAVREAVVHGSGVGLVPQIYCQDQLNDGRLVEVFSEVEFESSSAIFAVYPSRRLISNKVIAFLEFLQEITKKL